jgi:Uma2 family endonuclease
MPYTFTMTQVLLRASEPFTPHLFTVAEFERMFFAGVFATDTRAELLEGKVVIVVPQNPPHKYALANYVDILPDVYGKRIVQMPQMPLDVHLEHYQPEPDLAILKPPKEQYKNRKNQAEDVLWLIEVSDATLETDRTVKLPIYAACGIPEYWIHDVNTGQLEVYTDPNKDLRRYGHLATYKPGEKVTPQAFVNESLEWW